MYIVKKKALVDEPPRVSKNSSKPHCSAMNKDGLNLSQKLLVEEMSAHTVNFRNANAYALLLLIPANDVSLCCPQNMFSQT